MKRTRRKLHRRALTVERLESRSLLAGNVLVDKDGSTLNIRGDDDDNAIVVRRVGENRFEVEGIDDAGGNPTSVNGVANGTATFGGIKRDIDIRLRGGDDLLGVGNDDADLLALLDELTGGPAFVPGTSDRVRIKNDLRIDMGGGDDAAGLFLNVGDDASVDLGAGNDFLAIEGSKLGDNLRVEGQADDDSLRLRNTNVDERLWIDTDSGLDSLRIVNVNAEDARIDTGSNDDTVEVDDLDVDDALLVFLRDGGDEINIGNSRAKTAVFSGADGTDVFNDDAGNNFKKRQRSSFETIT